MTIGESGLAIVFAVTAFLCVIASAKALDAPFAFHAALSAAASLAAVFVIINRYFDRPAALPPQEINGRPNYNMGPIKFAAVMAMFWGIVGFLVGVIIASPAGLARAQLRSAVDQLRPPAAAAHLGGDLRLRRQRADRAPRFYVVQRTCRARLFGGELAPWFVVLGLPVLHRDRRHRLPAGHHPGQGIRRAGMVRRPLADHRLGRLPARLPRHDHASARSRTSTSPTGSTSPSSSPSRCCTSSTTRRCRSRCSARSPTSPVRGVQDAMIQWWYGHNAVGFFLTAGFLGMMYYFIPKQAERPVYSYRLSIVHFWALIFLYIWAGPHHLHYTALPDWAQTLGMVFSIMLWMPSWGGMINGLMTLSGAWDKLRTDPDPAHAGRRRRLLRHVDLRRPDDVDQGGQLARALHRLDHRPRAFRRARLGRLRSPSARSTAWCRGCGSASGSTACSWSTGTSGSRPSASCSTSPRCGSPASCRA